MERWPRTWGLEIVASPSSHRPLPGRSEPPREGKEEAGPGGSPGSCTDRRWELPRQGEAGAWAHLQKNPSPRGRLRGGRGGAGRCRPRGGPSAWQRDLRPRREVSSPASAAGSADPPHTSTMRPLLLLAPLGWLLLAEAKGDAKPEGEGAKAGGGSADPGGRAGPGLPLWERPEWEAWAGEGVWVPAARPLTPW